MRRLLEFILHSRIFLVRFRPDIINASRSQNVKVPVQRVICRITELVFEISRRSSVNIRDMCQRSLRTVDEAGLGTKQLLS